MWTNTILVIALTSVLQIPVLSRTAVTPEECCSGLKEADEIAQQFKFTVKTASEACTCTITTGTKRTIQVLLPLPEKSSTQSQPQQSKCVLASHGNKTEEICNEAKRNKFTAKGDIKITQVPSPLPEKSIEQITIEYQLVNDEKCAPALNPAGKDEQKFYISDPGTENIPAGLLCIWRVTNEEQKDILVQVNADSSSTENQCVTVSNGEGTDKKICGKGNENKFVSKAKDVTIKYEDPSSRSTVKNFQVSYRFAKVEELCGTMQYTAEETVNNFTVSATEAQKDCKWTVQTKTERTIQVSLAVIESSGTGQQPQCVQVSDGTNPKKLCDNEKGNRYTSKDSVEITLFSDMTPTKSEKKVTIEYQLVNDEQCAPAPEPAELDEKSFYISKPEAENIPSNLQCIWGVDTTAGENILVQVQADSDAAENQCVSVSDATKITDEKICTKTGKSQFNSNGQSVIIRYNGENKEVPNFKVFYKSSGTTMHISSVLIFLALYQFPKF